MQTLIAAERPNRFAQSSWPETTAIEPSEAADAIATALERQKWMLSSGMGGVTSTSISVIGMGSLGGIVASALSQATSSSISAAEALAAASAEQSYLLANLARYPLAAPTVASGSSDLMWTWVAKLATIPVEPLTTPTPPSGWGLAVRPNRDSPTAASSRSPSRAYGAFVDLTKWLGMTQEEAAQLLDVGRTTPLAWRRGHEPRPALARRLYQTNALVKTLVRRLGIEETRRWLARGDPPPLDLIAAGDVVGADDLAAELIFGTSRGLMRLDAWTDEPAATETAVDASSAPARRIRRPAPRRRVR